MTASSSRVVFSSELRHGQICLVVGRSPTRWAPLAIVVEIAVPRASDKVRACVWSERARRWCRPALFPIAELSPEHEWPVPDPLGSRRRVIVDIVESIARAGGCVRYRRGEHVIPRVWAVQGATTEPGRVALIDISKAPAREAT